MIIALFMYSLLTLFLIVLGLILRSRQARISERRLHILGKARVLETGGRFWALAREKVLL